MEKHIVVEDCTECPHYKIFIPPKDLPARSICGKHRMGKLGFENYNGPIKIPNWCPLDDAPESRNEFAEVLLSVEDGEEG